MARLNVADEILNSFKRAGIEFRDLRVLSAKGGSLSGLTLASEASESKLLPCAKPFVAVFSNSSPAVRASCAAFMNL